jgi:hypothetical protein
VAKHVFQTKGLSERQLRAKVEEHRNANRPVLAERTQKALDRYVAEKKQGRIMAAHKRWATRKANVAARLAAQAAL